MMYLYITLVIFCAFIIFQTIYILLPLFTDDLDRSGKQTKEYFFSVLVPAFNEERVIEHCINGFLKLAYKNTELIIINDGSKDKTLHVLMKLLNLVPSDVSLKVPQFTHKEILTIYESKEFPNIYVIDKLQGGKADALNAGINFSSHEIVVTLDADSILDKHAICEINAAFQNNDVIACGGNVLIAQGFYEETKQLKPTFKIKGIIRYQFLQYLTAFHLHKRAQSSLQTITVIAGAFGAFRKDVLHSICGFRNTIGEDMDITLKLHLWIKENKGKKIEFVPSAKCYTECPNTLRDLFKQRVRWQKAFIDCLIYYRKCFFTKFSFRFSIFFLVDQFLIGTMNAFPVIILPILIFFSHAFYILLILFGTAAVMLFMYQSMTAIYVSSLYGIKFSRLDIVRILLFLPIEIFIYRMINLLFVVYGTLTYFYRPQSWNKIERSGGLGTVKAGAS